MRTLTLTRSAALLLAAAAAGCGGSEPAVDGTVTLDGQPVEGALVRFHRAGAAADPAFSTVTRADGTFTLLPADRTRAGLPAGGYVVTVAKFKKGMMTITNPKDAGPQASLYPAEYADPAKSPFKVEVKPGSNRLEFAMQGGKKS